MTTKEQDYRCPQCHQISSVQKATLVNKLTPPVQPVFQSSWGCLSIIPIGLGIFFLIGSCYALVGGISQGTITEHAGWALFFTGLGIVSLAGIVLPIQYHTRKDQRLKIQYEAAMLRWHEAMKKWEQLYYCSINDIVFIPSDSKNFVTASDKNLILFDSHTE